MFTELLLALHLHCIVVRICVWIVWKIQHNIEAGCRDGSCGGLQCGALVLEFVGGCLGLGWAGGGAARELRRTHGGFACELRRCWGGVRLQLRKKCGGVAVEYGSGVGLRDSLWSCRSYRSVV